MNQAKGVQNDMKFELTFDYEILRLQFHLFICRNFSWFANSPALYRFENMNETSCWKKLTKTIVHFFTHTTYIEETTFEDFEPEITPEMQMEKLFTIENELKHCIHSHQKNTQTSDKKNTRSSHTKTKELQHKKFDQYR
jgi:hypothetical protein